MKLTKPALIAIIPVLMVIPWQHGGKEPAAMLVSTILAALGLFLIIREPGKNLGWPQLSWTWLALGAWAVLSLTWSVNRFQSVVWLGVWALAFFGFVFGVWLSSRPSQRQLWQRGYVVLAGLTAAWGLFIYISQPYERVTSSFYLANPAAAFLLPALLLGAWDFIQSGRRWLLGAVPIIAAGWFLADSRTSFILAAVAIVAVAMERLPLSIWKRAGMLLGLSVLMVGASIFLRGRIAHQVTTTPGARFSELATGESTSGSDRLYYLQSTLDITKRFPALGTGSGTFGSVHPSYQKRVISAGTNAHNFYAQTTSELGVIGAGLLLTWVLALFWSIWQAWHRKEKRVLAVVLVLMLVHLGLDVDAIYPSIMISLGVVAGLLTTGREHGWERGRLDYVAMVLALVMLLPLGDQYLSRHFADSAQIDQENGDYTAQIEDYEAAQTNFANPDVINAYGIALYTHAGVAKDASAQDLNQALRLARTAEQQDPFDAQHHFLEARVLLKQGNQTAAEAAYKRTIELDSFNHPEYYEDLANLYFQTKRYQLSQQTAEAALSQYPPKVIANRSFVPGLTQQLSLLYFLHGASLANQNGSVVNIKKDLNEAIKLDAANIYATDFLAHLPAE